MRVLLSDGSGLTARQVASHLGSAGHEIHVLSPDPMCLARFTRRVSRVWKVPPYGEDPLRWLTAALDVADKLKTTILFPTQEQVAVLSACSERVADAGVKTVVPSFAALRRVQDKVSAFSTLEAFGLAQPVSAVLSTRDVAEAWDCFPVYLKTPIGTATSGVRLARDDQTLRAVVASAAAAEAFDQGGLLAQEPVQGPLAMVQSVFDQGKLVAFHTNARVREGASGGASHKRSLDLPAVRDQVKVLGAGLEWHGALSADVILAESGPVFIDINPRLVEPGNARRSGVDLVAPMLELALGGQPAVQRPGTSGVSTHQLLLAVLGTAQQTGQRRAVFRELVNALLHTGDYAGSSEELTPTHGDWRAVIPVAVTAMAALVHPSLAKFFSGSAVRNYALTPQAWHQLLDDQN